MEVGGWYLLYVSHLYFHLLLSPLYFHTLHKVTNKTLPKKKPVHVSGNAIFNCTFHIIQFVTSYRASLRVLWSASAECIQSSTMSADVNRTVDLHGCPKDGERWQRRLEDGQWGAETMLRIRIVNFWKIHKTVISYRRGTERRAVSWNLTTSTAQYFEKSHLKKLVVRPWRSFTFGWNKVSISCCDAVSVGYVCWNVVNFFMRLLHETQLPQSECSMLRVTMNGRRRRHGGVVSWDRCVTPEWPWRMAHLHRSAGAREAVIRATMIQPLGSWTTRKQTLPMSEGRANCARLNRQLISV